MGPQNKRRPGRGKTHRKRVNAVRHELDGHKFDSTIERDRYLYLKRLADARLIDSLVVHPRFPLVRGVKTIYRDTGRELFITLDFEYVDLRADKAQLVLEDVKGGYQTPESRMRIAVFESSYGREVCVVQRANES